MPWKDNPTVPFDNEGNMCRVVYRWKNCHMVEVEPMTKALKFVQFVHLSSTISVHMEDSQGREYPMFLSEFQKLIQRYPLDKGVTPVLTWGYDKRGSAYGLCVPLVVDNGQEGV